MLLSDALLSRDPSGQLFVTSIYRHGRPTTYCYRWQTFVGKRDLERAFRGLGVAVGQQTETEQGWWIRPEESWQSET